ncbi:MAG: hypothetical protein A3D31_17250 [Candidatus Fluviicola riflensis]|nr:MAG: hypothetical protein CHH17_02190 [Candidatus Fluviicola riflensis]OGS76733.1 MAG: hypothetical protein A3D31_17250 [Candidatus Fluviicola riflensis]OGS82912.1 MAG: hypothetical protein A2724_14110 [Fluviicola sp. RIFCSPHIGHO2_01_FULL_43_53]OGS88463.1 MAG: hypothetical protein A3E30_06755 [Fluviicola sp. RIFCSPHIGHO2_12_FULL_43_24]
MRKPIVTLLLISSLSFIGKAQDCLWISPGLGVSTGGHSAMMHVDISATYLRYNRWGFSGNLQANGRTFSNTKNNTLKAYSGFGIQFAYNLLPYDENDKKLIARLGFCNGSGTFVNSYIGSDEPTDSTANQNQEQFYDVTNFTSFGAEASIEFLLSHRPNRAFSAQLYTIVMRHPFIGISLRFNLGKFE